MNRNYIALLVIMLLVGLFSEAQNPFKTGWNIYPGKDSSIVIRPIGLVQLQARAMQLNEGSISVRGEKETQTMDLAIARICLGSAFYYKRLTMFYLFGNSGHSITNGKTGNFYTYEAFIHYELLKNYLSLGLGQTLYNGISRASSLSISQIITAEFNYLALPSAGKTDGMGRQFHVFGIGQIGRLEYRAAAVRPMVQLGTGTKNLPELGETTPVNISYDFPSDQFGAEAYFCYQLFDKENIRLSSKSFSYLGSKKVANVGVGFEYQPQASAMLNENRDTLFSKTFTVSADAFFDLPLKSGAAFSAYAAFYRYDYGKNYLRSGGTMNNYTGGNGLQNGGNAEFTIGTGDAAYAHAAWLFARSFTEEKHRLQFYIYSYFKKYDALRETSWQPGAGFNYYIAGQNAKIAVQYYLRNVYGTDLKISERKHNVLVQVQAMF